MRASSLVVLGLLAASLTAGCTGNSTTLHTTMVTKGDTLAQGKGALVGLVIDDVYRPIPKATVYLFPLGHTVASDASGVFGFGDLEPGSYTVKVESSGHEAAPVVVDVAVGEFSEVELEARRLIEDEAYTVTTQFTLFKHCSISMPVVAVGSQCVVDQSDDAYPMYMDVDLNRTGISWLVAEAKMGNADNYLFQALQNRGDALHGNATRVTGTDYARLVLPTVGNGTDKRASWYPDTPLTVSVWYMGLDCKDRAPACGDSGPGVKLAMRTTVLLTAFVGKPITDPQAYQVFGPG